MFAFVRSRILNNIIIFVLGMSLAYSFRILFGNAGFMTASIGDAFKMQNPNNNYHISITNHDGLYGIKSLKEFTSSQGRSIRITMIYNKDIKEKLISSLQSQFQFSIGESSDDLIILFDLEKQTIPYGAHLLEMPLAIIGEKNIPIIHSFVIYDHDIVNNLSVKYDNFSEYH